MSPWWWFRSAPCMLDNNRGHDHGPGGNCTGNKLSALLHGLGCSLYTMLPYPLGRLQRARPAASRSC
eukprot:scaffold440980_cov13-Prasinocladus_malaysianus.AAC.1